MVPISDNFKERINKLDQEDDEPDGIQISNAHGNLTIHDFLIEASDDDSNASNESLKYDNTYQKEFDYQLKEEQRFMITLDMKNQST